jgi:hypothetical protein
MDDMMGSYEGVLSKVAVFCSESVARVGCSSGK